MNGDLIVINPLVMEYEWLIGGLQLWNFMTFHILGRIIPTDELIFFREVAQPPTGHIILAVFF